MYRDRHYSSKCHVNHNCIYVACTGTDITIRYAMYAISQSKTWGMYRDRHYSNLKCLSTEQLLRTFEVLVNLNLALCWSSVSLLGDKIDISVCLVATRGREIIFSKHFYSYIAKYDHVYVDTYHPSHHLRPPAVSRRHSVARAAQAQLAATPAPPCPEFSTVT